MGSIPAQLANALVPQNYLDVLDFLNKDAPALKKDPGSISLLRPVDT